MTISEALKSINTYPILDNKVATICLIRGLDSSTVCTGAILTSESYELATADVLMWLATAPDMTEQEVSLSIKEKQILLNQANVIYGKYGDPNFTGRKYGYKGEDYNA
jgi:hypothetical protein